jgi:hypothetical protein
VSLKRFLYQVQVELALRRCGELLKEIEAAQGKRTDLEPGEGDRPKSTTRKSAAEEAGLSDLKFTLKRDSTPNSGTRNALFRLKGIGAAAQKIGRDWLIPSPHMLLPRSRAKEFGDRS